MANVKLYTGTSTSARRRAINRVMLDRWDHALLLVPTRSEARQRLEELLAEGELPGAWGTPILTLEDLAAQILTGEGLRIHRIGAMERHMLVEGVVRSLAAEGKLAALGDAATSPGFVSHILNVITQLKQAAAEPEHFAEVIKARQRGSWLDSIVAAVYEGYQDALIRTRSYDRVGIYWRAELVVREKRPDRLRGIAAILLDDFEDFTPSEFRLLQALEPLVTDLVIGVDGDLVDPSRWDLFAIPRETHDTARDVWSTVEIENLPTPPPETLSEYLAQDIFWRQKPNPPTGIRGNVEIVECPDRRQEIEYVGRRVKTLLLDRLASQDQIVVVFREVQSVAADIQTVFDEFGIPVNIDSAVTLEMTPLATFVLNLFAMCDSWTRETVLDVVTSPWFAPDQTPQSHIDLFPLLARRAGIIEGQKEWDNRLRTYQAHIRESRNTEDNRLKVFRPMVDAITSLQARFAALQSMSQCFSRHESVSKFIRQLETALNLCGCNSEVASTMPSPVRERAVSSWRALNNALGRIDAWYRRTGSTTAVAREDFVAMLRNAFRATELECNSRGGVACRGVDGIRNATYDYVFLCGMNAGAFPRPPVAGAIYTDDDIADFVERGIQLDTKHRHASREMLAFQHVLRTARKALVITRHAQTEAGRATTESPFLADALEMLTSYEVTCTTPEPPVFVPLPESVASQRDLRNVAFFRSAALRERYQDEFTHALGALSVETARQTHGDFDTYDGVLQDPERVQDIAEQFGADHEFSVNQLEMYANCPFQFFMARILHVAPEAEPDTGFDPLVRGSILHDVLQAFHREFIGQLVSAIPEANADAAMLRHLNTVFSQRVNQSANTPLKAAEVEQARMAVLLRRYLTIARRPDKTPWSPRHFEVSFGSGRGTSQDSLSTLEPFVLATEQGPICFSGRIDRIDRHGDDARIIDYKTSVYAQQPDIDAGVSIQLPLYAMALEEHLAPGTTCAEALFVQIGGKKTLSGLSTKDVSWDERKETIRKHVAAHVRGIREGRFPPTPHRDMCRDCRDHRACRYESTRIERKGIAK